LSTTSRTNATNGTSQAEKPPVTLHHFAVSDILPGEQIILDADNVQPLVQGLEQFCTERVRYLHGLVIDFANVRLIAAHAATEIARFILRYQAKAYVPNSPQTTMKPKHQRLYLVLRGLQTLDTRAPLQDALSRVDSNRLVILAPQSTEPDDPAEVLSHHTIGASGRVGRAWNVFEIVWRSPMSLAPKEIKKLAREREPGRAEQFSQDINDLYSLLMIARVPSGRYFRIR